MAKAKVTFQDISNLISATLNGTVPECHVAPDFPHTAPASILNILIQGKCIPSGMNLYMEDGARGHVKFHDGELKVYIGVEKKNGCILFHVPVLPPGYFVGNVEVKRRTISAASISQESAWFRRTAFLSPRDFELLGGKIVVAESDEVLTAGEFLDMEEGSLVEYKQPRGTVLATSQFTRSLIPMLNAADIGQVVQLKIGVHDSRTVLGTMVSKSKVERICSTFATIPSVPRTSVSVSRKFVWGTALAHFDPSSELVSRIVTTKKEGADSDSPLIKLLLALKGHAATKLVKRGEFLVVTEAAQLGQLLESERVQWSTWRDEEDDSFGNEVWREGRHVYEISVTVPNHLEGGMFLDYEDLKSYALVRNEKIITHDSIPALWLRAHTGDVAGGRRGCWSALENIFFRHVLVTEEAYEEAQVSQYLQALFPGYRRFDVTLIFRGMSCSEASEKQVELLYNTAPVVVLFACTVEQLQRMAKAVRRLDSVRNVVYILGCLPASEGLFSFHFNWQPSIDLDDIVLLGLPTCGHHFGVSAGNQFQHSMAKKTWQWAARSREARWCEKLGPPFVSQQMRRTLDFVNEFVCRHNSRLQVLILAKCVPGTGGSTLLEWLQVRSKELYGSSCVFVSDKVPTLQSMKERMGILDVDTKYSNESHRGTLLWFVRNDVVEPAPTFTASQLFELSYRVLIIFVVPHKIMRYRGNVLRSVPRWLVGETAKLFDEEHSVVKVPPDVSGSVQVRWLDPALSEDEIPHYDEYIATLARSAGVEIALKETLPSGLPTERSISERGRSFASGCANSCWDQLHSGPMFSNPLVLPAIEMMCILVLLNQHENHNPVPILLDPTVAATCAGRPHYFSVTASSNCVRILSFPMAAEGVKRACQRHSISSGDYTTLWLRLVPTVKQWAASDVATEFIRAAIVDPKGKDASLSPLVYARMEAEDVHNEVAVERVLEFVRESSAGKLANVHAYVIASRIARTWGLQSAAIRYAKDAVCESHGDPSFLVARHTLAMAYAFGEDISLKAKAHELFNEMYDLSVLADKREEIKRNITPACRYLPMYTRIWAERAENHGVYIEPICRRSEPPAPARILVSRSLH